MNFSNLYMGDLLILFYSLFVFLSSNLFSFYLYRSTHIYFTALFVHISLWKIFKCRNILWEMFYKFFVSTSIYLYLYPSVYIYLSIKHRVYLNHFQLCSGEMIMFSEKWLCFPWKNKVTCLKYMWPFSGQQTLLEL